ncbi:MULTISPECIES: hypothetical protein [Chitinophagaceae]
MQKFLFFLLVIFLASAAQAQFSNPFTPKDTNSHSIMFAPISYIGYIEKGNKIEHSDSLSLLASHLLSSKIIPLQTQFKTDSLLPSPDTATANILQYELNNIINDENFGKKKLMLPPYLDSLLMDNNHTYGILLYQNGFLRKKGNFGGQVWKSIGIGILTMGSYYTVPQKSSANMYLFLLDGKKKTIECIAQNSMDDKNPIEEKTIDKQLKNILQEKNKKRIE